MRPGRAAAVLLLAGAAACGRPQAPAGKGELAFADVRALLDEKRYDEALARLGDAAEPEASYLAGRAWAGKAALAPVPTPQPGATGARASRLKPEEERALAAYERAVQARPDFVDAQLAIAELLAPHALAAAAAAARGRPAAPAPLPDPLVEQVLASYGRAVQADLSDSRSVEGLIDFALRVGRPGEADAGFQELVKRRREDPAVLVRYGDFLAGPGAKPDAALAQYAQALIWRPDDAETKAKMAAIHLAAAAEHIRNLQYVVGEARLKEARRYTIDPTSPQAARLAELEERLREVRGR